MIRVWGSMLSTQNSKDEAIMKEKKHFTLVELMAVVIITGLLVTFGVPIIRNSVEAAKSRVCTTNLMVLQSAIEAYALENDLLPATLSQLNDRHFRSAVAQVLKRQNGFLTRLAYFVVDFDQGSLAYAGSDFVERFLGGNRAHLRCPSDKRSPVGYSYGLNRLLQREENRKLGRYQELKNSGQLASLIVADAEGPFVENQQQISCRHKKYNFWGKEKPYGNYTYYLGALHVGQYISGSSGSMVPQPIQSEPLIGGNLSPGNVQIPVEVKPKLPLSLDLPVTPSITTPVVPPVNLPVVIPLSPVFVPPIASEMMSQKGPSASGSKQDNPKKDDKK